MSSMRESAIDVQAETHLGWPEDPDDQGRVSLTLDLSPEVNALLDNLANQIHGTKGDVLRKAVGLFKLSMDARRKGLRVGTIGPDQELETEFVGF